MGTCKIFLHYARNLTKSCSHIMSAKFFVKFFQKIWPNKVDYFTTTISVNFPPLNFCRFCHDSHPSSMLHHHRKLAVSVYILLIQLFWFYKQKKCHQIESHSSDVHIFLSSLKPRNQRKAWAYACSADWARLVIQ